MGLNIHVPFFSVLAFCMIMYLVNGIMNGDEIAQNALEDLDEDSGALEVGGAWIDLLWGFISFGNVPWVWLQVVLSVFCGGILILGMAVLLFEVIPG